MGQAITTTQFFLYGKKHFTKTGYLKHIRSYKEPVQDAAHVKSDDVGSDGVDLKNKVVIVTGANSGMGKEIATYVASKHAKLYMVCRSSDKAEMAKSDIVALTNADAASIQIVIADVAERSQIREAARYIQSKESQVHCLVCNAGVLLNEQKNSSEGIEMTFASHLLCGTYLFTELLMPQLRASGTGSRVVIVTSGGMYNTKVPSWNVMTSYTLPDKSNVKDDADEKSSTSNKFQYSGNMAYAYAKRGQVILAEEWTKKYTDTPVAFVTVHPGWTDTPAVDEAYGDQKKYLQPMRTPWQGSEGITWLIGTDVKNLQSGALYLDRETQTKHMAGPFFTEGHSTKNTPSEVDAFMRNLHSAAELS